MILKPKFNTKGVGKMKHLHAKFLLAVLIFACAMPLVSCGQKTMSLGTEERLMELGQEFINELTADILPLKDTPRELQDLGYVVSIDDSTYGSDAVYAFYKKYQAGETGKVTIIFSSKAFVVTRVYVEGNTGYYLRYSHNPKQTEGPLAVTSQIIDNVTLTTDTKLNKAELSVSLDKKNVATFSMRNLVVERE